MNVDIPKTFPDSEEPFSCKTQKNSKRKRRKNKYKHFKLKFKKKYQKSVMMDTQQIFSKHGKPQMVVDTDSNWYWSNYKTAVEWQDKYKIAYWKSRALALQEENRNLLKIIERLHPGMRPDVPFTKQKHKKKFENKKAGKMKFEKFSQGTVEECSSEIMDNDNELQFEMSEEMIKFFEQSFKHKMDLKKEKEEKENKNDVDNEIKKIQMNKLKRTEEMKLLYGDGASMIIGMETAVQLSFDKYCDTKSPKYWPNIPLNL